MTVITDAAVEAARLALEDTALAGLPGTAALDFSEFARAALEASAPQMLAKVWRAGYEYGYEDGHCEKDGILFPEPDNPYRTTK